MKTLEDYLQMEIVRDKEEIGIVISIYRGHKIMMVGFDNDMTDYEIAEEAFYREMQNNNLHC